MIQPAFIDAFFEITPEKQPTPGLGIGNPLVRNPVQTLAKEIPLVRLVLHQVSDMGLIISALDILIKNILP